LLTDFLQIEVLLSNPNFRTQVERKIIDSVPQRREQLRAEIKVIRECLGENSPTLSTPNSAPSTIMMNPRDWRELPTNISRRLPKAQTSGVSLPKSQGSLFDRIRFNNKPVSDAGLSPLCSHAYFLREKEILVYSLELIGPRLGERLVLQKGTAEAKYLAATLSERYVAILVEAASYEQSIHVFRYDGKVVGVDNFGVEANKHKWNSNSLITAHDAFDCTWVAVGGCIRQGEVLSGSIKMYCITENGGNGRLNEPLAPFNRPRPNPLASNFLKTLAFSPDGRMLVCATNNNEILVWRLSADMHPEGPPFIIRRDIKKVSLPLRSSSSVITLTAVRLLRT
jgi:hypothetical protein